MKLVADIDTITSNLSPLTTVIEDYSSAVSAFDGAKVDCSLEEVSELISSYKASIGDDLNKINTGSHDYNNLVTECCSEYKANEENIQAISMDQINEVISKCADVTIDYQGNAANKLTKLPSTSLYGVNLIKAQQIVNKYKNKNIKGLSNSEFLDYISAAAQIDYAKSGVLPSVTIAQAICESGWGNYAIGNNIFGIKCGSGWKGKRINCSTKEQSAGGSYYSVRSDFRDYDSIVDGVADHSDLLHADLYKPVLKACKNNDAYEACRQLKKCGYATSHSYANTLISIIEANDLTQYDPKH